MLSIKTGKPFPTHEHYASDKAARAFWRASFRCGRAYRDALDPFGETVLIPHELETDEAYRRRKRITKPRGFTGPLLRRFNDFVFRKSATIPPPSEQTDRFEILYEDADGKGTPWDVYWRRLLLRAQIDREAYNLIDSNVDEEHNGTEASAKQVNARPLCRPIGADSVLWWEDDCGKLAKVAILMTDEAGQFVALFDSVNRQKIRLEKDSDGVYVVRSIEESKPHKWDGLPVQRLRPQFDDIDDSDGDLLPGESQAAPIADSQMAIYNCLSLLNEEIYSNTYTQWVAWGVDESDISGGSQADGRETGIAQWGNNRMITMRDSSGRIDKVGSDPAQAQSIRVTIADEEAALMRSVGLSGADPLTAESGIARQWRFNDLAATLCALADSVEEAENEAMRVAHTGSGSEAPKIDRPDDYDLPDFEAELRMTLDTINRPGLPNVLRKRVVNRFVERNLSLTEDEDAELDAELISGAASAPVLPFPSVVDAETGT